MVDWYPWVVLAHIVGAFGFVLAHGVSAFAAFRLRRERRPEQVVSLLELSAVSVIAMYPPLLLLLVAGIAAGFMGDWWGRLWIWLSLGLLLAILVAMYAYGMRYYTAVRHAVGLGAPQEGEVPAPQPLSSAELDRLLTSPRAHVLAAIGGIGLLLIIWLMVLKPF